MEGKKQTIWVPGILNFQGKWGSPTSACGKLYPLPLGEEELLDPTSSLPGNSQGVPGNRHSTTCFFPNLESLFPLLPALLLPQFRTREYRSSKPEACRPFHL